MEREILHEVGSVSYDEMLALLEAKLASSSSSSQDEKEAAKAKKRRRKTVAAAFQAVASMKERHATGADRVRAFSPQTVLLLLIVE